MKETGDKPKKESRIQNFITRTVAGAVLTAIAFACTWFGGYVMFAFAAIVGYIGMFEFYRLFGIHKAPIGIIGYAAAAVYLLFLALGRTEILMTVGIICIMVVMVGYVFHFNETDAVKAMAAATGFVLVLIPLSYLYRVRMLNDGNLLIGLTFIASSGCDICAYLFGMAFGKHRMSNISPKKTIEGAVGGILGVIGLAAVYGAALSKYFEGVENPVLGCVMLCIPAALISMVGDLAFSAFKRNRGVKDYSHLIPGHGGILDRFDSVIFVAPVVFLVAQSFVLK
ncbi:MAG: phosphatidate cytidylyltransferase [Lachnospiraceae bacterium]|nr:phosphatidate cytidylyltransferase [Lachnospiraceae bacterium]